MLVKIVKKIVPSTILGRILAFKNNFFINGFSVNSYSQEGEDMILRRIFENSQNGFFIDVGAHHPKRFSNTYLFYKKGWRGINIDAMPGSMKLFNKLRPSDLNLEIPISNEIKKLKYYIFDETAYNGFSVELSDNRIINSTCKLLNTVELTTRPLNDILDQYLPLKTKIDFLTIDVEGLDFMVLKSINLNIYRPRVILIELISNDTHIIQDDDIYKYLFDNSYIFYAKTINTCFFVDKSININYL